MPCAHFSLSPDPLHADLQLQHVLKMSTLNRDASLYLYSAKRSRSAFCDTEEEETSDTDYYSEVLSDESGRFDDADEAASPHSVKRRRSNDWPFKGTGSRPNSPSRRRRKQSHAHNRSNNNNSRFACVSSENSAGTDDQPRRSRFIEERMCDSVSEEPPSIFTGDNARSEAKTRNSGSIFRFGRAIAAAFNPFGSSWRFSSSSVDDAEVNPRNDAVAQVERAYEELKRAGYKGTAKGSYSHHANNRVDSGISDQTWKTIQERMGYPEPPTTGRHSRQDSSGSSQISATPSRRNSLKLFRTAKSSHAVPSATQNGTQTDGPERSEVRRKKSRKELQKQAKLIKRVSNLEDKLDRARRELREVVGEEEELAPKSLSMANNRPYPRKFVPGALPTLPSERLLDRHAASESLEPEPVPFSTLSPNLSPVPKSHEEAHNDQAVKNQRLTTEPSKFSKSHNNQQPAVTDSSQRKRKSPGPASKSEQPPTAGAKDKPTWSIIPPRTPSMSRKPKHPKTSNGDSPTSGEVRQSSSSQGQHKPGRLRRRSPAPPTSKRTAKSSPRLRMRQAQADLRSTIEPAAGTSVSKNTEDAIDGDSAGKPYPSPGPGNEGRGRSPSEYYNDDDCVPPVPPIPQDVVAATATSTFDERSFREREKRNGKISSVSSFAGHGQRAEEFRWPEEFF